MIDGATQTILHVWQVQHTRSMSKSMSSLKIFATFAFPKTDQWIHPQFFRNNLTFNHIPLMQTKM